MLKDIMEIPEQLSSQQMNWLRMVASAPQLKALLGDFVTEEDIRLAEEAKQILKDKGEL